MAFFDFWERFEAAASSTPVATCHGDVCFKTSISVKAFSPSLYRTRLLHIEVHITHGI